MHYSCKPLWNACNQKQSLKGGTYYNYMQCMQLHHQLLMILILKLNWQFCCWKLSAKYLIAFQYNRPDCMVFFCIHSFTLWGCISFQMLCVGWLFEHVRFPLWRRAFNWWGRLGSTVTCGEQSSIATILYLICR